LSSAPFGAKDTAFSQVERVPHTPFLRVGLWLLACWLFLAFVGTAFRGGPPTSLLGLIQLHLCKLKSRFTSPGADIQPVIPSQARDLLFRYHTPWYQALLQALRLPLRHSAFSAPQRYFFPADFRAFQLLTFKA
jgi:hypothetical protein